MKAQIRAEPDQRERFLSQLYGEKEETEMMQANLGNCYFRQE
jgi:hypothetical protein